MQRGRPRSGQIPERGVVEAKPDQDELDEVTTGEQVARYWSRYQLVLVTNLREFRLVGPDPARGQKTLETFRLADTATDFHQKLQHPRAFARDVGARLVEYLARALAHRAALAEPKDLAWLLASYARDGLSRVEAASGAAPFESLRTALEEALGIRFEGERGKRFFPVHAGADALLRGLLGLGAVGAFEPEGRALRLAHRSLASARPGAPGALPTALRSRASETARSRRSAGLDCRRARPRRPDGVLRSLPGRGGGSLLLRAVPRRLRSGPPASSSASGTPRTRSSATWSPAWTER